MIVCSSIVVVCSMSELAVIAVHKQWDRHAHVGIYLAEIVISCRLLHNTRMNGGMVGRSRVGWWGGVQWDGGEEYSGMVGGVQWDGGRSTVGW